MRTKTLYRRDGERIGISRFPNFHKSGSIAGMIKLYYGKNALLVRCGRWWKSYATLTLLAKQDCPFWLQYD